MESERPKPRTIETYKQQEDLEEEEDDEENNEILKRRISNHPLYGLLVETHLDCLKVFSFSLYFNFPPFPAPLCINLCTDVFNSTLTLCLVCVCFINSQKIK